MPLLDLAIPHLLGGVSQQPPAGRQAGQVEACDNALLHVVNGLSKRPGTRHVAKLFDGDESVRLAHWINRDTAERYLVLLGERRVRVFDADTGAEFQVKVNGTSTNAGRGRASGGTPINYLEPRVQRGIVDQDEDFVIGAGDWLSVAGNSVTSYVAGRGPFKFGRRESTSAVTADTVAEVGNGAAASVSDIHQIFGDFAELNSFSVFVKKSASAISDVELTFNTVLGLSPTFGARFAIDSNGVVTFDSFRVPNGVGGTVDSSNGGHVRALVEEYDDGWYRCTIQMSDHDEDTVLPLVGTDRDIAIRFHTTGVGPANMRCLLFGARCYDLVEAPDAQTGEQVMQAVPDYVHERSDLFRALTIADSTLLLNTEQTVGATTGTSASGEGGGLKAWVFIRRSVVESVYKVILRDTSGVSTPYEDTATATEDTVDLATEIVNDINADTKYNAVSNVGSTFLIFNDGSTLGAISCVDGQGSTDALVGAMSAGGQIKDFTLLPVEFGSQTPIVKIVGQDNNPRDDFYVRPRFRNPFSNNDVFWEETLAPSIPFTLAASTLPFTLSRRQDNSAGAITGVPNAIYFDVSETDWDDRLVGDTTDTSNPDPGFVGQKINDLFLYRGRLGFLSQDKVILSEAGEILNFWRTTVRELPDTDPIELSNATATDTLRNAAASGDQLIVSSTRRQFQLIGEPALTPASAQLVPLRGFELLASARPVDTGRGTIFARLDARNTGLTEASVTQDDLLAVFEDLTPQAPRYILGEAVELVHSSLTHLTAVRAGDPSILYLHQTFFDDQENRLQSAVHRWTFHADTLLRGAAFFEEILKVVVEREEGWCLEQQPTGADVVELTGLPITHLDRRLTEEQVVMTYDGGDDETTIELPYEVPDGADMRVVDAASGLIIPIVSQTSTTLVVSGDITEGTLYIGETFEMAVELTRPVVQEASPRGGLAPRLSRPTDVRRLELYLADTAFLRVEIAVDLRDPSSEEFSAAGLGTGLLDMGELNTYTGRADFGVYAEAAEMALTLRNATPFPSRIQAGRWEVLSVARAGLA